MTVGELNFQSLAETQCFESDALLVKIRYAAPPVPCRVRIEGERAFVSFPTPVRAITPGQSAVFYDRDGVIAFGGFIEN